MYIKTYKQIKIEIFLALYNINSYLYFNKYA